MQKYLVLLLKQTRKKDSETEVKVIFCMPKPLPKSSPTKQKKKTQQKNKQNNEKVFKWVDKSGVAPKKPFKVGLCNASQEIKGEKDDLLWTGNLSGLKQLCADTPELLKQIKWK